MKFRLLLSRTLACLSGIWLSSPANAQFDFTGGGAAEPATPVQAELIAAVTTIAPGKPFEVVLKLTHAPGWHTYYLNPGQVGNPPDIEWALPAGFQASSLRFPVPSAGEFSGAVFYGYHGEEWFSATITPPAVLPEAGVTLTAAVSWLACKEQCLPGSADFRISLATNSEAVANPSAAAALAAAKARQPLESAPWTITARDALTSIDFELVPNQGAVAEFKDLRFFSSDRQDDAQKPQVLSKSADGKAWLLRVPRAEKDALGEPIAKLPHVSGILVSSGGWITGDPSTGLLLRQLPLASTGGPAGSANPATPAPDSATADAPPSLLLVFAAMFAGGLILNLMPCVFPVIGLKIMGFVQQAGHDHAKVVRHGLIFTLGVLVSFWILSGLLLAGGIRNWGGQMQNPWVVFTLMLVMLFFAMNMFGVFEFGTTATGIGGSLTQKQGLAGSFFSGVLATVVATPCTAPVLAYGLSAAVTLPPLPFMIAFTLMALGLSLPYLVLSLFPKLVDKLPRPGPWMESFKQGMSFLLFGTVGYLLWVYSGQVFDQHAGQKGLSVVLGLSAVAAGLWVYGRWSLPHRPARARWTGRAIAAALVIGGAVAAKPDPVQATTAAEASVAELDWQPWSADLQQKLLAEGRPVFVDFTAKWCLTCQTNKAAAYTAEVRKIFHDRKVATLRADQTTTNPPVDAELRRLGKAAIPVNVLHLPGKPQPVFTNTVLTAGYLRGFLEQHLPAP